MEEVELKSEADKRYAPSSLSAGGVIPVEVDPDLEQEMGKIPDKLAFKIGEVADLLGVKAYVLRYWETEFEILKPKKSKHNQRMYERRDVENLMLIKKLLYRDRFSIEGARTALKKLRKDNVRVKRIRSMAEHVEEAKDRTLDLIDEIRAFRQVLG
ncbi:MAG: MerR family transcriptional regulator [Bdellovibrionales bacterium]